ncbi:MAG: hypothetical protein D0530_04770 [Methylococcales bacterium]|nr:MAG: hypothetical protein D0530_04770 [Methylococcales bacterium]
MANTILGSDFQWLTSNRFIAYPFVDDGTPVPADDYRALFADGFARFSEAIVPGQDIRNEPLELIYFTVNAAGLTSAITAGPTSTPAVNPPINIKLRWTATSTMLLDTTVTPVVFSAFTWGTWVVAEWTYLRTVIRFVFDSAGITAADLSLTPTNLILLPSRVENWSNRVYSVGFQNGNFSPEFFSGDLILEAGYSTDLSNTPGTLTYAGALASAAVSSRLQNFITVSAIGGAGAGWYSECNCGSSSQVTTINGIAPNSAGNISLLGDSCISFRELRTTVDGVAYIVPNQLLMNSDCKVCCDCNDYITEYNNLRAVWLQLKAANDTLTADIEKYTCIVEAMNAACACISPVSADVKAYSRDGWSITVQVILGYSGPQTAIGSKKISIAIDSAAQYIIVPQAAFLFVPVQGVTRIAVPAGLSIDIPYPLNPGSQTVYEVELYFTNNRAAGLPVSITATCEVAGYAPVSAFTVGYLKPNQNRIGV